MSTPRKRLLLATGALLASTLLLAPPAAQAATGASAQASSHAVTTANRVPTITKLSAGNHAFGIAWRKVAGATHYRVTYAPPGHVYRVSTTHPGLTVKGLVNGQRYRVKVRAYHHSRALAASPVRVVTPHAPVVKPAPPAPPAPAPTPPPAPSVNTTLANGIAGTAAGATASLKAGTYSFSDFTQGDGPNGFWLPASLGKLQGAGVDKTVVQMNPHTSTKASRVPTASGTTNQLSLLGVVGSTALSDFTLRGTDQGHLYNGLRVSRTLGTKVTNVRVTGVPGNKNYPPGETFGINDYRTNGSVYTNIEVDGQGVGAAGFGGNNSQNIQINGAYFHDNPYSAGITFWQSDNITLTDVRSENNHGAFNFERDSGTIKIIRPEWKNIGNKHAFSFNSDQASAKVSIYDPVLPAGTSKIYILVAPSYLGVPNKQQVSDIHVYQHGVDVTSKLVVFAH